MKTLAKLPTPQTANERIHQRELKLSADRVEQWLRDLIMLKSHGVSIHFDWNPDGQIHEVDLIHEDEVYHRFTFIKETD